ncbi:twin-arginine translocation signal domain-containing protein [Candidatus Poribacteria bacterium]|nr:twin-arginine translocation signal domain-containing protein [Candidatus Poribacteria bacterium]
MIQMMTRRKFLTTSTLSILMGGGTALPKQAPALPPDVVLTDNVPFLAHHASR